MKEIHMVCFDLDDTLTREIDSVTYLCMLAGRLAEKNAIQALEDRGEIDWVTCDHRKAALLAGLPVEKALTEFARIIRPLKNVADVMAQLRQRRIRTIVVTAGPVQVARAAMSAFQMDDAYGSEYGEEAGVFTGKIDHHIGDRGKIACLEADCRANGIAPERCVAVGDGSTDIPLFEYCRHSIAINYSPATAGKARFYLRTDDLADILPLIIQCEAAPD